MTEDIMLAALFGGYFGLMGLEALRPGRDWGTSWKTRLAGMAWFAVSFGVSSAVPLLTDAWLAQHTLFDLTVLGTIGGAVVGTLVYQLVGYAWHRALHTNPVLWRIHQTHHSIEQYDVSTTFVFHPVGMALWTVVGSLALVGIVGLTGEAALLTVMIANSLVLFQHSNLRTPRWLGYLVARPESHALHHARHVHGLNYADLPVFDMLFGTFRNPADFPDEIGLGEGASARVGDLILGVDVQSDDAPVLRAS